MSIDYDRAQTLARQAQSAYDISLSPADTATIAQLVIGSGSCGRLLPRDLTLRADVLMIAAAACQFAAVELTLASGGPAALRSAAVAPVEDTRPL